MDAREGARRHCGVTIRGVPTLRKDGRIYLTFGLNMTDRISDHPMNEADFDVLEIKSTIVLKDGETGFIGGVTRKCMETEQTALPGLSALPGIGSWFQFSRRVVIDQEILVLITPKIVHDHRR
jgi:type II secretory pathway component GspD/PulD (secretin)